MPNCRGCQKLINKGITCIQCQKSNFKKVIPPDYWLWDYKRWRRRLNNRNYAIKNLERKRLSGKLAMRKFRKHTKDENKNRLIRAVYYHEINHPNVPIGSLIK